MNLFCLNFKTTIIDTRVKHVYIFLDRLWNFTM